MKEKVMQDISIIKKLSESLQIEAVEYRAGISHQFCYELDATKNVRSIFIFELPLERIPTEVFELRSLQDLRIHSAKLENLSENIGRLENLKYLSLYNNNLKYLPKSVNSLSNLLLLSLYGNRIEELPSEIGDLTNLRQLILYSNNLKCLPPEIGKCLNLRKVDVDHNQLFDIPKTIGKLKKMLYIFSENNKLEYFPYEIEKLKLLRFLWLSNNNIQKVPPEIKYLSNLEELYLLNNPIKSLSSEITELKKLNKLKIDWEKIEDIPPTILDSGTSNILKYLKNEREIKKQYFTNEAKLIIVGEGGVGKTCLVNKLKYDEFFEEKGTIGIDVSLLRLKVKDDLLSDIYFHVWDFAGQEISQATHLFFLTNNSIYILVWNARQSTDTIFKWLEWIKAFGQNSPVILVMSKCKEMDGDLNYAQLKETYTNIKSHIKIDSKDGTGIDELNKIVANVAIKLPTLRKPWRYTWYIFLKKIESIKKKWIEISFINKLAEKSDVNNKELDFIINYLICIGKIIHYRDIKLKNFVVLDPEWITEALYALLNAEKIIKNNGVLYHNDLTHHWPINKYPIKLHSFLLELLEKFEFAYPIRNMEINIYESNIDYKNCHLIPALLPGVQPNLSWDYKNNLIFIYIYDFLPTNIFTRLIVRLHHIIDIDDNNTDICWGDGVIFRKHSGKAFVELNKLRKSIKN